QFPTLGEHKTCNNHHFQQVAYNHKEAFTENTGNGFDVIDSSGGKSSYSASIKIFHFEAYHKVKQFDPQIANHVLPKPVCIVSKSKLENHFEKQNNDH